MKRRISSTLMALVLCLTLLPAAAYADGGTAVYVSSSGSDDNAGTQTAPYATLAKAVTEAADGATIYVMSNLTMTECARFYDKKLTITSLGDATCTITRGDNFAQQQDNARSTYNPAMIEVQTTASAATLTLTNIILDDGGKHKGDVFAQAISGEGKVDNSIYVQDAIVASNATVPCTITLGEGAILRNFGGMSAVRVTEKAKLVMESGSKIEDTTVTDRVKGPSGSVGPAGAIWMQGGEIDIQDGAVIESVVGRAIYADGGTATINGTISGIKSDRDMWQGTNGAALHLRNGATGVLNGRIEKSSGSGHLIDVEFSTFEMTSTAKITSIQESGEIGWTGNVIFAHGTNEDDGKTTVEIDGEIVQATNGGHVLQTDDYTKTTVGKNGNIHHNSCYYGALYLNGENEYLDFYGKVNNNYSTNRGGGIVLANNGGAKTAIMYEGAEVKGNIAKETGGGIMVSVGSFTMKGGEISGNIAGGEGGGVYVRRGGQFMMQGGEIKNNSTAAFGGGIAYSANDYSGFTVSDK